MSKRITGRYERTKELFAVVAADRSRALAHEGMSVGSLRLLELLPRHPW